MTVLLAACAAPPQEPVVIATLVPTEGANPTNTPIPSQTPEPTATRTAEPPLLEPTPQTIVIPIAIYILDDANGEMSSGRTVENIEDIYLKVNEIWSQANVQVEITNIDRVEVSQDLLIRINNRDFFSFFNAVNSGEIYLPSFAPIVGFYTQTLGGPNGINPSNSNTFFVMDTPSVFDERVTSHEIGHILGLHHVLDDPGRLMFSGTNGMALSEEEIVVSRYSADGLLRRLR
ncbi:MAG: hypothetical protein AAGD96_20435 [Chloroflexota bacterium]